jgi:hypothetical protein
VAKDKVMGAHASSIGTRFVDQKIWVVLAFFVWTSLQGPSVLGGRGFNEGSIKDLGWVRQPLHSHGYESFLCGYQNFGGQ